jgi:hypothetical protein
MTHSGHLPALLCGEVRCFLRRMHLVEVGAIHWIYGASSAVIEPM